MRCCRRCSPVAVLLMLLLLLPIQLKLVLLVWLLRREVHVFVLHRFAESTKKNLLEPQFGMTQCGLQRSHSINNGDDEMWWCDNNDNNNNHGMEKEGLEENEGCKSKIKNDTTRQHRNIFCLGSVKWIEIL